MMLLKGGSVKDFTREREMSPYDIVCLILGKTIYVHTDSVPSYIDVLIL
jgi:hypothetical protein